MELPDIEMNRRRGAGLLAVVVLVLVATPILADRMLIDTAEREYGTSATVVSSNASNMSIGVDPGANLDFGRVTAGIGVRKFMNVNVSEPVLLTVTIDGNISEHMTPDSGLYIDADRQIELEFKSNTTGYYEGVVTVQTQVASAPLGARWLKLKSLLS